MDEEQRGSWDVEDVSVVIHLFSMCPELIRGPF